MCIICQVLYLISLRGNIPPPPGCVGGGAADESGAVEFPLEGRRGGVADAAVAADRRPVEGGVGGVQQRGPPSRVHQAGKGRSRFT